MVGFKCVLALPMGVWSHGMMVLPVPNSPGALDWHFDKGSSDVAVALGASSTGKGNATCYGNKQHGTPYDPKSWYTNRVTVNGKKPWFKPGQAKVWSSCGVLHHGGSDDTGCDVDYGHDPYNTYSATSVGGKTPCDGRKLVGQTPKTVWPAGSIQDVAWAVCANHYGGVAYRLCPLDQVTEDTEATEACFQAHQLDFADDITVVRFADSSKKDLEFQAEIVSDIYGKQWKKSIIRSKNEAKFKGGYGSVDADFPSYSQLDHVKIPQSLTPGHYVLSWRWDCEETPQVWLNCADIEITSAEPAPTPVPPSPAPTPVPAGACVFQEGGTVNKNMVDEIENIQSQQACCDECVANADCSHFTWISKKNQCNLRSGSPEYNDAVERVSGEVHRTLQI